MVVLASFNWKMVYEGQWQGGGQGVSVCGNGGIYEGQHREQNRHGKGVDIGADGGMYDGEWEDDKPHGTGTETDAGGAVYDGEWKDGNQHGNGTFTFGKDGSRVSGWEWVQCGDKYEGPSDIGKWTWAKDGKTERIKTDHEKSIEWPDT